MCIKLQAKSFREWCCSWKKTHIHIDIHAHFMSSTISSKQLKFFTCVACRYMYIQTSIFLISLSFCSHMPQLFYLLSEIDLLNWKNFIHLSTTVKHLRVYPTFKLKCQTPPFHGCWPKTWDFWVRDDEQLVTAIPSKSQSPLYYMWVSQVQRSEAKNAG